VRNCTPRPEPLGGLTATGTRRGNTSGVGFPVVTLAPGAAWHGAVVVRQSDRYRIRIHGPGKGHGAEARVQVVSTELTRVVRECRTCPWNASALTARTCRATVPSVSLEVPAQASLSCTGPVTARSCTAAVRLVVRNCTGAPAILEAIDGRGPLSFLGGGAGWRPVPLAPGAVWTGSMEAREAGPHTLSLRVRYPHGTAMNAPAGRFQVRDPERERAQRDCRRCRGTWGRHGLLGLESCVCRTQDAGRRCYRSQDCASECLVHRFVITRPATAGRVALGIVEGRCAATTPLWGCARVVTGAHARPRPVPAGTFQTRCAD
jgi:hypothetical protein